MGGSPERLRQAHTVAVGCDQLPESFHGKEGSTVRVRQRALEKRRKPALFRWPALADSPACDGYGALYGAFRFRARAPNVGKSTHLPERLWARIRCGRTPGVQRR